MMHTAARDYSLAQGGACVGSDTSKSNLKDVHAHNKREILAILGNSSGRSKHVAQSAACSNHGMIEKD